MMYQHGSDVAQDSDGNSNTTMVTQTQEATNNYPLQQSSVCIPQMIYSNVMMDNFKELCTQEQSFVFGPSPLDCQYSSQLYPGHPVISQSSPTHTLLHQPPTQASSPSNVRDSTKNCVLESITKCMMYLPDASYSVADSWQNQPVESNQQSIELENALSILQDHMKLLEHKTHPLRAEQSTLISSLDGYLSDSPPSSLPITEAEILFEEKNFLATNAPSCCKFPQIDSDGATSVSKASFKITRRGCIKGKRTSSKDQPKSTYETKEQKEEKRRFCNNVRERTRVKDMNKAFKELERLCKTHFHSNKAQTKLSVLHQAVSTITSLKEQLQDQSINPKAVLMKVENRSHNSTEQDPSLISNNVTHTTVKLDTTQQFCSSPQSLGQQVNAVMAMISTGDVPTSSNWVKAVSVSKHEKVTPFGYDQQTLH